MARFNSSCKLVSVKVTRDENGAAQEERTEREVMANVYSVSADAELAARAQGLRLRAVVQVRSCEYNGEAQAVYDGELLDIEGTSGGGEFVRLTLTRRLADAQ
jgi:hypothetical protein